MPSTNGSNKDNSSILVPSITPVGVVLPFAGTAEPAGWLLCYGQTVNRLTYAALFAIIGTTYGAGDGSTTFHLPDLRGRAPAGRDNMGGASANRLQSVIAGNNLGAAGGGDTHTLTTAQLAAHNHSGATAPHTHTAYIPFHATASLGYVGGTGGVLENNPGGPTVTTSNVVAGIYYDGGGQAHPNLQPTIVLNSIIKY